MKKLVIIIVVCITFASCGRIKPAGVGGADNTDNVYAFFCMPENLHFCKPLVIISTENGWVARYGGSEASDSLILETAV